MAWVPFLMIIYLYLFTWLWRVELTADEFRWHTVLRAGAVPFSRVQSIRRGTRKRNTVYVKVDGRWLELDHRIPIWSPTMTMGS